MSETECPTCAREFETSGGMKGHHARVHGESIAFTSVSCAWCSSEFEVEDCRVAKTENFLCSEECESKWRSELYSGEENPAFNSVSVCCQNCGDEILVQKSRWEELENAFCDKSCHGEYTSTLTGEDNPQYDRVSVECSVCGAEMKRKPYRVKKYNLQFCSQSCHSEWRSGRLGPDAPHYKGGGDYGDGWNNKKKRMVRERDGRECVHCGMCEQEHINEYGTKLHVHHITPARLVEDEQERNSMGNLEAVCWDCHLKVEALYPLRPA